MSLPEWINEQLSPKDPERRERWDRASFWVLLPLAVGYVVWRLMGGS